MKEHPIIFSDVDVRAILDGRKTQTRRPIKPQPDRLVGEAPYWNVGGFRVSSSASSPLSCPYGQPGDRLWVRETWGKCTGCNEGNGVIYRADGTPNAHRWRPSIHMPRWASRLTLEVVARPPGP